MNVGSIYAWEGKIEQAEEVLMIIKTQSSRYTALEEHIRMHHPYDTIRRKLSKSLPAG